MDSIAEYGWIFGALWFASSVLSLVLHDPTTDDPELEKLWRDNL
jgi:hypothetical protein